MVKDGTQSINFALFPHLSLIGHVPLGFNQSEDSLEATFFYYKITIVLILYAKFVLVNYLPICSKFISVLFFMFS